MIRAAGHVEITSLHLVERLIRAAIVNENNFIGTRVTIQHTPKLSQNRAPRLFSSL